MREGREGKRGRKERGRWAERRGERERERERKREGAGRERGGESHLPIYPIPICPITPISKSSPHLPHPYLPLSIYLTPIYLISPISKPFLRLPHFPNLKAISPPTLSPIYHSSSSTSFPEFQSHPPPSTLSPIAQAIPFPNLPHLPISTLARAWLACVTAIQTRNRSERYLSLHFFASRMPAVQVKRPVEEREAKRMVKKIYKKGSERGATQTERQRQRERDRG